MPPPKPTLNQLLDRWNPEPPDDARMEQEVWRRIGRSDRRPLRLLAVGFFAAACLAGALVFGHWRMVRMRQEMSAQLARQYLQLIDPLLATRADTLDAELAWIRADLNLTPEQFLRIKALHAASLRGFVALNTEAVKARREFARLEEVRRNSDEVDFLAFARLTDSQNSIDRRCRDSTLRLARATASVMTPEQRQRYLRYVRPALVGGSPPPGS